MDQKLVSVLETSSNGDRRLRDLIKQNRIMSIATILLGLSQIGLSMSFLGVGAPFSKSSVTGVVLAVSGFVLVGIGLNVFQGQEAFDGGWNSERWMWVWTVFIFIYLVGVAALTMWVVFS